MLRMPFASERIQRVDPRTGVKVIQLTGYPVPAAHFLYDWPCVTPDNQRVVLFCQRAASRNAPWDLFRVDADGLNLFQLTERGDGMETGGYYGRPGARLTLDGTTIYCVWGRTLCAVDVETGATEELCSLGAHVPEAGFVGNIHISASGRRLFITYGARASSGAIRVDLDSGEMATIDVGGHLFACDPIGPRLVVSKGTVEWGTETRPDGSRVIISRGDLSAKWITDEDGKDIEYFCPEMFAHATLLGKHLTVQGCGKPPHKCIWLSEKGVEPRTLAEGPYFWHSGASWNGEWIAADTNWPDQGLQLVHVPTGHFATLCHAGASQEHYEFGHPHPCLSQDGRLCVFRSDRTGVPQTYVAHIPREFQERVIAGELHDAKWMP
jgi:oligogalacturonide lyase